MKLYSKGKKLLILCILISFSSEINAQLNLAEKMGYDKEAKLLIIHADDMGVSHAENVASIKAIEEGVVTSGSIMMPTPWVSEVVKYAHKRAGTHDLGLHLTLTAEWENYKWGAVAPKDKIPSLLNDHNYFHANCIPEMDPKEVEIELRAQIELAFDMGIDPTHIDSHMGCLFFGSKALFEIYVKLSNEYSLPCLIDPRLAGLYESEDEFKAFLNSQNVLVVVNEIMMMDPEQYKSGAAAFYESALRAVKPGLSEILIHPSYADDEMHAVTEGHPDYGAEWRQEDFDYFTSKASKKVLEEEGIILVTWREISKALNTNN